MLPGPKPTSFLLRSSKETSLLAPPIYFTAAGILLLGTQRRSEAYADAYGIPSTYVYTMMSWLREEPMAEHVAVEFWSGSGRPLKCLRTLPLQFLKSPDG